MLKCEFLKRPLQGHFEIPSLLTGGLQSLQPQLSGKNDTAILSVRFSGSQPQSNIIEPREILWNQSKDIERRAARRALLCPVWGVLGTIWEQFLIVFAARVRMISIQWRSMEGSERFRKKTQSQSEMDCDPDCVCRLCLDVPTPQADSDCKAIEVADIMKTCETWFLRVFCQWMGWLWTCALAAAVKQLRSVRFRGPTASWREDKFNLCALSGHEKTERTGWILVDTWIDGWMDG